MSETQDIFTKNIVNRRVKITPNNLHKDFKDELLNKLKKELEGKYSKYGFIKENSIEILKYSLGELEQNSLEGNIIYNVRFTILVCNPVIGNIIKCKVIDQNKFGLSCKDVKHSIIHIIVPKKTIKIKSEVDVNNILNDDIVYIEIIGKKPILNNNKINCFGRVIKTNSIKNITENTEKDDTILLDGTDEYNDILSESDDESDDESDQEGGEELHSDVDSDADSLLSISQLSEDNLSEMSDVELLDD